MCVCVCMKIYKIQQRDIEFNNEGIYICEKIIKYIGKYKNKNRKFCLNLYLVFNDIYVYFYQRKFYDLDLDDIINIVHNFLSSG